MPELWGDGLATLTCFELRAEEDLQPDGTRSALDQQSTTGVDGNLGVAPTVNVAVGKSVNLFFKRE